MSPAKAAKSSRQGASKLDRYQPAETIYVRPAHDLIAESSRIMAEAASKATGKGTAPGVTEEAFKEAWSALNEAAQTLLKEVETALDTVPERMQLQPTLRDALVAHLEAQLQLALTPTADVIKSVQEATRKPKPKAATEGKSKDAGSGSGRGRKVQIKPELLTSAYAKLRQIDPAERSATAAAKLSTALSVDCGCGSTWLEVQFGTSYTSELRALAREIEAAVRAIVGSPLTKEYAKKVRSLEANLALEDNGALRQRVLSRELPATALVQMEHAKLAPLGQQEEISNRLKAIKRSVTIEGDDVTQVYAFGSLVRVRSKSDPEDEIGGSPDGEIGPRLEFAPISDSSATSSAHKRMRSASPRPER